MHGFSVHIIGSVADIAGFINIQQLLIYMDKIIKIEKIRNEIIHNTYILIAIVKAAASKDSREILFVINLSLYYENHSCDYLYYCG